MGLWARKRESEYWHLTGATATTTYRQTRCGLVIVPCEVLGDGELPPEKEPWCFSCYEAYWREARRQKEAELSGP